MIKIVIVNEGQVKIDFLSRLGPLVKSRITFYQSFFQYLKGSIKYDQFVKISSVHRHKKTLINVLLDNIKIDEVSEIELAKINAGFSKRKITRFLDFLEQIKSKSDTLLVGKPNDLLTIHKTIFKSRLFLAQVKPMCELIFDYDLFYKSENQNWGYGAELANQIDINVCPYCNRNFVTTVICQKSGEKIVGPTFDHFFSQKDYPLFLISLFNLVPSCTVCNSNLKHEKKFDLIHFLYPYDDEMGDDAWFDFKYKTLDLSNKAAAKNYEIFIAPKKIIDKSKELKLRGSGRNKLKGSLNVFKIEEIYSKAHADLVGELAVKCDKESLMYARSVMILLGKNGNIDEFYRFYFGNYLNKDDWNKRPLAKLTYDIVSRRLSEYRF